MKKELEKLIDLAIADGEVTEKEKNVLVKKATELGVDIDELEMVLDAKLHISKSQSKVTQSENLATNKIIEDKPGVKKLEFKIDNRFLQHSFTEFKNHDDVLNYYKPLMPGLRTDLKKLCTHSNIPPKKRFNASNTLFHLVEQDEIILLYHDSTLFGKGDDGLLVTNKKLIVKPYLEIPICINYSDDYKVGFMNTVTKEVDLTAWDKAAREGVNQIDNLLNDNIVSKLAFAGLKMTGTQGQAVEGGVKVATTFLKGHFESKTLGDKKLIKVSYFEENFTAKNVAGGFVISVHGIEYPINCEDNNYAIAHFLAAIKSNNVYHIIQNTKLSRLNIGNTIFIKIIWWTVAIYSFGISTIFWKRPK
jgi:hypothetical protein